MQSVRNTLGFSDNVQELHLAAKCGRLLPSLGIEALSRDWLQIPSAIAAICRDHLDDVNGELYGDDERVVLEVEYFMPRIRAACQSNVGAAAEESA